jgi:hypothetical protein
MAKMLVNLRALAPIFKLGEETSRLPSFQSAHLLHLYPLKLRLLLNHKLDSLQALQAHFVARVLATFFKGESVAQESLIDFATLMEEEAFAERHILPTVLVWNYTQATSFYVRKLLRAKVLASIEIILQLFQGTNLVQVLQRQRALARH